MEFLRKMDPFVLKDPSTKEEMDFVVLPFDRDRKAEFYKHDDPDAFFSPAERSRLVNYLLELAQFGDKSTHIGINRYLKELQDILHF